MNRGDLSEKVAFLHWLFPSYMSEINTPGTKLYELFWPPGSFICSHSQAFSSIFEPMSLFFHLEAEFIPLIIISRYHLYH
jgi:hypothetical protein